MTLFVLRATRCIFEASTTSKLIISDATGFFSWSMQITALKVDPVPLLDHIWCSFLERDYSKK